MTLGWDWLTVCLGTVSPWMEHRVAFYGVASRDLMLGVWVRQVRQ